MLMLDITIDHGSSGGPLVNSRGEVVGITTAGKQGSFGFAVPINQAIPLLRRVPGFDPSQMGKAAAELPFRQIRDRMTPVTVFLVTDQGRALELPSRYDTTKWPRQRGFTCREVPHFSSDCYLDRNVPPGLHLVGYIEGVADEKEWSRDRLPPFTEKPVWFGQRCGAWVMQFATSAEAQKAARALSCCRDSVWEGDPTWDCFTCSQARTVISSTRVATKGVEVTRTVARLRRYHTTSLHTTSLTYVMVATVESYVIVLAAKASLQCEDNVPLVLADEQGLRVERFVFFGSAPPPYVVMTYDDFIKWATDRDKELLEFILAQF